MARSTPEWIGKTDDTNAPPRVRIRLFDKYNGICQLSKRKINAGEKWELHHIKALIEGGENRETNLVPVLVAPHKAETKKQMAVKKIVNRKRTKHLGIKTKTKKIQSRGFASSSKRKVNPQTALPPKQIYG